MMDLREAQAEVIKLIGNPSMAHAAQRNVLHSLAVPHGFHSMHMQFPTLESQLDRGPSDPSVTKHP